MDSVLSAHGGLRRGRIAVFGCALGLLAACSGSTGDDTLVTGGDPTRATVDATLPVDGAPAPSATAPRSPAGSSAPSNGVPAEVVHVDDGDSIIVDVDGVEYRVRLIGINAPERGECEGANARQFLASLIEGRQVLLEADVEDTDQFGRLLRYVWVDDVLVNAEMTRRGLAISRPFEPNITRQVALDEAEEAARSGGTGLWNPTACGAADSDSDVAIVSVSANPAGRDEENLNGEFVVIENAGADVNLGGFVLRDSSSVHRFEFPREFVLRSGGQVVVFVGCGADTATELYWCAGGPVWDNSGDEAFLVTPEGAFLSTYTYP